MNSICLSAAPNLRCEGLTRTENIVLFVPPALELVFSLTLALARARRGRRHWLLVLDGLLFFLLALADFLAHVLTQANSTLGVFTTIDIVVAAASFLPLLTYTLFLFLLARASLVALLPTRFRLVATVALFLTIPPIVVFNALASLLGVSHRTGTLPTGQQVLAVGFASPAAQRLALFFSSTALALLTLFQATLFTLCFIRVVHGFLDERRIESARDNPAEDAREEIHLFRGIGWLAVGLKLGAVESVVGFADVAFAVALTRRVLRLFGRGALIIGVIKGMNVVEDFVRFETDVQARRRRGTSRRSKRFSRFIISNPRNSTFRELSPHATSFHAAQREKKAGRVGPSPLALGAGSTLHAFKEGASGRRERVTVLYDGKTPPTLQVRFSSLDMAMPPLPTTTLSLSPVKEEPESHARETWTTSYGAAPPAHPHPAPAKAPRAAVTVTSTSTSTSAPSLPRMSSASDSLEAVREIASRFPNLPPRVVPGQSRSPLAQEQQHDPDADWRSLARERSVQRRRRLREGEGESGAVSVSPGNSIKRKPAPPPPQQQDIGVALSPVYASALVDSPASLHASDDDDDDYSVRTTNTQSDAGTDAGTGTGTGTGTPGLTRVSTLETAPTTPAAFTMPADRPPGRLATRVMAIESKMAQTRQADADAGAAFGERRRRRLTQLRRELRAPNPSADDEPGDDYDEEEQVEIPWLHSDPLTELQTGMGMGMGRGGSGSGYPLAPTDVDDEDDVSDAVLDEAWRRAGLTRIKSVSQVRVRTTPRAERGDAGVRGSLFAVEEEDLAGLVPESFEEEERGGLERVNESLEMERPARLDSGVLAEEDRSLVRQGIYV